MRAPVSEIIGDEGLDFHALKSSITGTWQTPSCGEAVPAYVAAIRDAYDASHRSGMILPDWRDSSFTGVTFRLVRKWRLPSEGLIHSAGKPHSISRLTYQRTLEYVAGENVEMVNR